MFKKIREMLKIKKVRVITVIIALIAIVGVIALNGKPKSAFANSQRTAPVQRGDIAITVSGSGPIQSSSRYEITPSVSGKIKKVYLKEGDKVKAGDLIAELDDTDGKQSVYQVQNSIREQNLNKLNDSNNLNNLKITAPITGYVSNLSIKEGDTVAKNSAILTIIDKSRFIMSCDFREVNMTNIKKGTKVRVFLTNFLTYLDGTVSYISDKGQLIDDGGILHKVEVTVNNPGYSLDGTNATIEVDQSGNTILGENSGTFAYANTVVVRSLTGGSLKKLYVKEGQYVTSGQTLAQLDNQDLKISQESSNIKQQDLNLQLADARNNLSDYKFYAPGDGVIVSQDLKPGDSVKPADIVSTIADKDNMQFDISIDELDIAKIKVGQKANITVDALPDTTKKPLTGSVVKVAEEGTSTNGVTTYPVTIKIDNTKDLKAGMNANAQILINEKKDVLLIPVEAVTKNRNRNFVTLGASQSATSGYNNKTQRQNRTQNYTNNNSQSNSGDSRQRSNNFIARANMRQVELGINNEQYVEVISGLKEGEEVILPSLATNTTQTNNAQMRVPFGGGMGGSVGGQNNRRNNQSGNSSASQANRGQ